MTIFDQFRRQNSNISNFLPIKFVNFDTKIKVDHFSSSSRICSFWAKMDLWHTVRMSLMSEKLMSKSWCCFKATKASTHIKILLFKASSFRVKSADFGLSTIFAKFSWMSWTLFFQSSKDAVAVEFICISSSCVVVVQGLIHALNSCLEFVRAIIWLPFFFFFFFGLTIRPDAAIWCA